MILFGLILSATAAVSFVNFYGVLMPTFMPISSYSLILILNVGESVGKSPPVMALDMFPIAFGRFFIKSSGDVNATIFIPNGW